MTLHRVRFRQSGGFAGLVRACDLTPDSLDAHSREELERLVAASGLAARDIAASSSPHSKTSRDVTQYDIEIELPAGRRRATLTDHDLDGPAGPLIAFLQKRARPFRNA